MKSRLAATLLDMQQQAETRAAAASYVDPVSDPLADLVKDIP